MHMTKEIINEDDAIAHAYIDRLLTEMGNKDDDEVSRLLIEEGRNALAQLWTALIEATVEKQRRTEELERLRQRSFLKRRTQVSRLLEAPESTSQKLVPWFERVSQPDWAKDLGAWKQVPEQVKR